MKFTDLIVGDWFYAKADVFLDNSVFMKISENEIISINGIGCPIEIEEDFEIVFCSKFSFESKYDFDFGCGSYWDDINPNNFEVKNNYELYNIFADLPDGAIYKGKGQTYYKKIGDCNTVVFWSPKASTIGTIYTKTNDDINYHIGTYYLCKSGIFEFPEVNIKFPYMV